MKTIKNTLSVLLLVCISATLFAQTTRTFDLKNFNKLDLSSAFKIDVKQGSFYSIIAEGDKDDLDDLVARVSSTELQIKFKDSNWGWKNRRHRVNISIVMPNLKGIDFTGASTSTVKGFGNQGNVEVKLSGASTSEIEISADDIKMDISGASKSTFHGKATNISVDLSGASHTELGDFPVQSADIEASGASFIRVSAAKSLSVDASGASTIRYKGTPSVKMNTSGASSVKSE